MAKDSKGHGSEALHEHRGWTAQKTKGGVSVIAPNGRLAATHSTLMDAKQAMPHYAKGYESAQRKQTMVDRGQRPKQPVNVRGDVSSPKPPKR